MPPFFSANEPTYHSFYSRCMALIPFESVCHQKCLTPRKAFHQILVGRTVCFSTSFRLHRSHHSLSSLSTNPIFRQLNFKSLHLINAYSFRQTTGFSATLIVIRHLFCPACWLLAEFDLGKQGRNKFHLAISAEL